MALETDGLISDDLWRVVPIQASAKKAPGH